MQLEIVTPSGHKLSDKVHEITAPGVLGEMGILPGHIPVLTVLDIGRLSYKNDANEQKILAVNGGFLEVDKDTLIVITETAEFANEIDVERAKASLDRADKALASMEAGSEDFARKLRSRKRAENRIAVAAG